MIYNGGEAIGNKSAIDTANEIFSKDKSQVLKMKERFVALISLSSACSVWEHRWNNCSVCSTIISVVFVRILFSGFRSQVAGVEARDYATGLRLGRLHESAQYC